MRPPSGRGRYEPRSRGGRAVDAPGVMVALEFRPWRSPGDGGLPRRGVALRSPDAHIPGCMKFEGVLTTAIEVGIATARSSGIVVVLGQHRVVTPSIPAMARDLRPAPAAALGGVQGLTRAQQQGGSA